MPRYASRHVAGRWAPLSTTDDERLALLLADVARGCPDSFEAVHAIVHRRVRLIALRVLRAPGPAEEATQETLLQLWLQAGRFDPARGTASAWVSSIAHRRAIDRVRVGARDTALRLAVTGCAPTEVPDAYDEVLDRLHAAPLRSHVASLTPLQREVLELRYLHGRTDAQAASELSIPLGTAKTRIRDALQRLRLLAESDPRLHAA